MRRPRRSPPSEPGPLTRRPAGDSRRAGWRRDSRGGPPTSRSVTASSERRRAGSTRSGKSEPVRRLAVRSTLRGARRSCPTAPSRAVRVRSAGAWVRRCLRRARGQQSAFGERLAAAPANVRSSRWSAPSEVPAPSRARRTRRTGRDVNHRVGWPGPRRTGPLTPPFHRLLGRGPRGPDRRRGRTHRGSARSRPVPEASSASRQRRAAERGERRRPPRGHALPCEPGARRARR